MTEWYDSEETVLVLSDLQAPFEHPDALDFLVAVADKYEPTRVVCIGDLTDSYHLGAWAKAPEAMGQSQEIEEMLEFVQDISAVFPDVDILTSNHDLRLIRAAHRAQIHPHFLKGYHEWMGLPKGWKFHDKLEIDGIMYTHGDETGSGASGPNAAIVRAMNYGCPVVHGHFHTKSEIAYVGTPKALLWGMFVGSLVDHSRIAFAYAKKSMRKPVLSTGVVVRGKPVLEPMVVNSDGRWVGYLI